MTSQKKEFDVIVIGGGPGGYPAAIRAAQNGKTVALVEANEMGGTCLNRGCIPSKTLIASADVLHKIQESEEFGIVVGKVEFNYSKMVDRKNLVVGKIRKSLEGLIAANKITIFRGFGKLTSQKTVKILGIDNIEISAEKLFLPPVQSPAILALFLLILKKSTARLPC